MKESLFNIKLRKNDKFVIYNSLSSGVLALDKEYEDKFNELVENSFESDKYDDLKTELRKGKMIINDSTDEVAILQLNNNLSKFNSKFLGLTIAPTMECNFDCIYCYEKGVRNNSMSEDTIVKTIEYINSNIIGKKALSVCWYGGEPLLAINKIEKIYNGVKETFPENFEFHSSMVTNGYLLNKEMAEKLRSLDVSRVQITLDGEKEDHDKRRYLLNKQGTYDVILKNIKEVCDIIDISIRINVDKENEAAISNIMNALGEAVLKKVNVYIAAVDNINDTFENSMCLCNKEFSKLEIKFVKGLLEVRNNIQVPTASVAGCGANSFSSVVIDALGDFYKCWNHMGQENRKVGSLDKGVSVNETFKNFVLKDNINEKCKKCKILPLCYGGCSDTHREGVDINKRCSTYKYNIREYIELFIDSKINKV